MDRHLRNPLPHPWGLIHCTIITALSGTMMTMLGIAPLVNLGASPLIRYGLLIVAVGAAMLTSKILVKATVLKRMPAQVYYLQYLMLVIPVANIIKNFPELWGVLIISFFIWLVVGIILGWFFAKRAPQGVANGSQSSHP